MLVGCIEEGGHYKLESLLLRYKINIQITIIKFPTANIQAALTRRPISDQRAAFELIS